MSHTIIEACIGCGACKKVCPNLAITGELKSLHYIDAAKCVDCSVCGMTCTKDAVIDQNGKIVPRVKIADRPKPIVNKKDCSACFLCNDFCRANAIKISEPAYRGDLDTYAEINFSKCVSCGLCASNCPMNAITMGKVEKPAAAAKENTAD
jgi:Na+-translocating ferredoxin:NAD+ oxidoreductase subunit B